MAHHLADVVACAIGVLDEHGLADLSMRRLAAELDVQPSALYHHVADKQTLLAAVADEVLDRATWPTIEGPWDERLAAEARALREAMLAYRDGAELVATAWAFGLGAKLPHVRMTAALADEGDAVGDAEGDAVAVSTLLHFVFGHVADEQTHLQAASAGAIRDTPAHGDAAFTRGLAIIVDGIRAQRLANSF